MWYETTPAYTNIVTFWLPSARQVCDIATNQTPQPVANHNGNDEEDHEEHDHYDIRNPYSIHLSLLLMVS